VGVKEFQRDLVAAGFHDVENVVRSAGGRPVPVRPDRTAGLFI